MRWTIPNILTVARLFASLVLVAVYLLLPRPLSDWIAVCLFVGAALTDYIDGYLARRLRQITAFGRMLDPIADKTMTVIALVLVLVLLLQDQRVVRFPFVNWRIYGDWLLIIPVTTIIFREVFISGLREFLGSRSGGLPVTQLAKWKTTVQMTAIAVLFTFMLFEHYFSVLSFAMDRDSVTAILYGGADDPVGLRWKYLGYVYSSNAGLILLWLAAALTAITGFDYFRKALPILQQEDSE